MLTCLLENGISQKVVLIALLEFPTPVEARAPGVVIYVGSVTWAASSDT